MTAEQFVDAIKTLVMDAAVSDTLTNLARPPGRSPGRDLLELSAWFNGLSESDREMARRTFALAAHAAVFGFLAVLDGSRTITTYESAADHFELRHVHGAKTDVLSGPSGRVLHELL
jgi:hypothetical protein